MAGLRFRRSIKMTQNATRAAKRKSQAFKSGSNQTADTRLAVRVRGKIGDMEAKMCFTALLQDA